MLVLSDNSAEFTRFAERWAEDIRRDLFGVVQETCLDGAEHARTVGRYKDHSGSNGLRASIKAFGTRRTADGARGSFGTTKPYARHVKSGTSAHVIKARRRSALRWEDGGEVHFARSVQHPGTAPSPFMGPAFIKAQGVLMARAETLCSRAIRRFGS